MDRTRLITSLRKWIVTSGASKLKISQESTPTVSLPTIIHSSIPRSQIPYLTSSGF